MVKDGSEAVEMAAQLRPDVVVMDITMPGLSGIEATRTITEKVPSVGVVILSMHSTVELIRQALEANYDVKIAAARVLQAQAVLGITRADQFPTISGGASALNQGIPETKGITNFQTGPMAVNLSLVWELDFWCKFRGAVRNEFGRLRSGTSGIKPNGSRSRSV